MKISEGHQAKTVSETKISSCTLKNHSDDSLISNKIEKTFKKKTFLDNENFKTIRAMLLALSILILCYYGPVEYSILENGQILRGFFSKKTVVTVSLGYSILHSIISAIAVVMLIYSIIMKRPRFSLPLIGLFLTELVYDSCEAIVTMWYFFKYLQLQTALFYAIGLLLVILAQIWAWLGVLKIYKH